MSVSSGVWFPALSSRELKVRPIGRTRFGERVVFWRDGSGRAACLQDRCAHRGAALSLGRVRDGCIECPFHGFRYDAAGQCTRIPVEESQDYAAAVRVPRFVTAESDGYVWVWRGTAAQAPAPPPALGPVAGLAFGETHYTWNAHYTRCIENVLDFSHLPFVHPGTIGRGLRDAVCPVSVESVQGGFRARRERDRNPRQYIEFLYPNLWFNVFGGRFLLAATFVPVDDDHTETYVRWYYPPGLRVLAPVLDILGTIAQDVVFRDDLPIVESQQPRDVDDADSDRLVPSDAAVIAYRKLRRK